MVDIDAIRSDFPILDTTVYGKPLVYLDNAATTQKPRAVLDRVMAFYTRQNSNIHRGVHFLSEQASAIYESARKTVQTFINASKREEIVFTRGTTESINLIAHGFGDAFVQPGDEILITQMEHHSNLVPWQMLCQSRGAALKVIPVDESGRLVLEALDVLMTDKTRLLALTYVSNALGVVNPVERIIEMAHARDVPVMLDAAQAVQHMPLDVQALDCDFLVFSGHKMYAETGVGVLYGKERWLEAMPPYQLGGGMIRKVRLEKTTYAELPFKFEAGTGNIAAAISLAAAIDYLQHIGLASVRAHESRLIQTAVETIGSHKKVILYGNGAQRCGVLSFNLEEAHPYDVGMVLDKMGIAVRTGLHCAEPLMERLGIQGTVRASVALYNTPGEIERLAAGIRKACTLLCPD
jgi:cysteine desulfurase/selenocysteine lyase